MGRGPASRRDRRERRRLLLTQVRARLERFGADHDPATVLDPEATTALTALLEVVPDPAADLAVAHAAGWLHWLRYLALDPGADQQDLTAALTLLQPVYQARPDSVPEQVCTHFSKDWRPPSDNPKTKTWLRRIVTRLEGAWARRAAADLEETLRTGDPAALTTAIGLLGQALAATPTDHPDRARYLSSLGTALHSRFGRTGSMMDLDGAVVRCRPGRRRSRWRWWAADAGRGDAAQSRRQRPARGQGGGGQPRAPFRRPCDGAGRRRVRPGPGCDPAGGQRRSAGGALGAFRLPWPGGPGRPVRQLSAAG
jgi:hypothetical protein